MRLTPLVALCAAASLSTTACKVRNAQTSDVKVVNGIPTNAITSIVKLDTKGSVCTGTFVDATTVVTAAHCVRPYHEGDASYPRLDGARPLAVFYDKRFFELNQGTTVNPAGTIYDLAVIRYPWGVSGALKAQPYLLPSVAEPRVGQDIVVIGYGMTDILDPSSNPNSDKHFGANVIAQIQGGVIFVIGPCSPDPTTTAAAIAPGDSGGPMLNSDTNIVGIASAAGCVQGKLVNRFVPLNSALGIALLQRAIALQTPDQTNPARAGSTLCGFAVPGVIACINGARNKLIFSDTRNGNDAAPIALDLRQLTTPGTLLPDAERYLGLGDLSALRNFPGSERFTAATAVTIALNAEKQVARLTVTAEEGTFAFGDQGIFPVIPGPE